MPPAGRGAGDPPVLTIDNSPGVPPELHRQELARLGVTFGLLCIAAYSIVADMGETMAGAIIGYVAHYWLPPVGPVAKLPVDG